MTLTAPIEVLEPGVVAQTPARQVFVDQLRQGDADAWTQIVVRYDGLIRSTAHRFGLSQEVSDDVAQQTWLRLFEHIDDIRDIERVGLWLRTTARRECLLHVKRSRALESVQTDLLEEIPAETSEEERADDRLLVEQVLGTVDRLPDGYRDFLRLALADPPASYRDISRHLGIAVGTIGSRRRRCLDRLRSALRAEVGIEAGPVEHRRIGTTRSAQAPNRVSNEPTDVARRPSLDGWAQADGRAIDLLLVRHGQSIWNAEKRWQGQADPDLSELGRRQAAEAGDRLVGLDLQELMSSDLRRASQTAAIIANRLEVPHSFSTELLRERDAGEITGLPAQTVLHRYPDLLADHGDRPPGFEEDEVMEQRVLAGLRASLDRTEVARVALVTHAGVLRTVERVFGLEYQPFPNTGGLWLHLRGEQLVLGDRVNPESAVAGSHINPATNSEVRNP